MQRKEMPPIAVVGVGALFPGGTEPEAFWQTIIAGRDCLTDIPRSHWLIDDYYDSNPAVPGKTYARRGAFIGPVDFDLVEHGIPPNVAPTTDTAQLLALLVAKQVLENSCDFSRVSKDRTAVILGVASATELVSTMSGSLQQPVIEKALKESGLSDAQVSAACARVAESYVEWTESTFPGLLGNVVAGRIANRFDLGGMNCVIDAACASSLGAIKMAIDELWTGGADAVVTGGVDAINDIFMYMCFSKTLAMSRTGDCRPFSDDADGTMLGEGIGMFVLRRLEDAERDGDAIYAVIRGLGASSDGRSKSIYAPRAQGQAKALRRAYEAAGYDPSTVGLMEAHGTGTIAGDAAEIEALKEVFHENENTRRSWCALGSIKSQIGHTKAAAGAASLYKAVMALHHKTLPPTIKVRVPNPSLHLSESPFYLNTAARPWISPEGEPRRASVSSFGFGGSNYHLTLEEYRGPAPHPSLIRTVRSELFLFLSDRAEELRGLTAETIKATSRPGHFARAARRTQIEYRAGAGHRLAIVASDAEDLAAKTNRALTSIDRGDIPSWNPSGIAYGTGPKIDGKIAFIFPGQGSQYLEMGGGLALMLNEARRVWDGAADIAAKVFPPPVFSERERDVQVTALRDTRCAQPAIGLTSEIYLALLKDCGIQPEMCAGHSFGELTALLCASVVTPDSFLAMARKRGELMAEAAASNPGAMASVAAGEARVREILPAIAPDLVIANVNSPRQIVIAGPGNQIDAAVARFEALGITARRLPVAAAFHSPIVEPAVAPFAAFLDGIQFKTPQIPVFANSTAQHYPADGESARALLGGQIARPVRFADEIGSLYDAGARIFIEVGPGSVLTDLVGAGLEGKPHFTVSVDTKGKDAVTGLWCAFARLAAAGIAFDTAPLWKDYSLARKPEPERSSATISISGTNFGKKYPREHIAPIQPVVPPASPAAGREAQTLEDDRFATIRLIQEKMAEAHAAAQHAMAESHMAYLRASELALSGFSGGKLPEPIQVALRAPVPNPAEACLPFPAPAAAPAPEQRMVPPLSEPTRKTPPIQTDVADASLEDVVLSIIADKTGYPRDVLAADMDLEADLGVDSIKRVQILAEVAERRPDLPAIEASAMGGFRTIGTIVAHLRGPGESRAPDRLPVQEKSVAKRSPEIARIGLREIEAPLVNSSGAFPKVSKMAIVGCHNGIGIALAQQLTNRGINAGTFDQIPADADGAVILDFEDDGRDVKASASRLFAVARRFASNQGGRGGALFVVQSGDVAWRSGLIGLTKTLALEHPNCQVRAIEVDRGTRLPAQVAQIVADELVHGGNATEVIVKSGGLRLIFEEMELPIPDVPTSQTRHADWSSPVIVASGGARGVTAACLIALAGKTPARFALLGRTALSPEPAGLDDARDSSQIQAALLTAVREAGAMPSPKELAARAREIMACRDIRKTLEALRGLGSEAMYLCVDVTDSEATSQAVDQVRGRWAPIDVLIHAAGVLADKRIIDKTPEQFQRVFDAKVLGLQSLLSATGSDPLRFICLFSSVAGRYGNVGQADYAMANAAMNRIAREQAQRRGADCIVRSLNWGPWDGGMVTPELREHFQMRGIPLIPVADGTAAFVREFHHASTDPADVDVVLAVRS